MKKFTVKASKSVTAGAKTVSLYTIKEDLRKLVDDLEELDQESFDEIKDITGRNPALYYDDYQAISIELP